MMLLNVNRFWKSTSGWACKKMSVLSTKSKNTCWKNSKTLEITISSQRSLLRPIYLYGQMIQLTMIHHFVYLNHFGGGLDSVKIRYDHHHHLNEPEINKKKIMTIFYNLQKTRCKWKSNSPQTMVGSMHDIIPLSLMQASEGFLLLHYSSQLP